MKSIIDLTSFKPDDQFEWEDFVRLSNQINSINQAELSNELETQAAVYSYYGGVLSKIKREVDLQENTLSKLEADIRSSFYKSYKDENKAKPTDKMTEAQVIKDESYQLVKRNIIDLEYKYNLFKGLLHGLDQKKDCLIQLSSNRRAETKLYDRLND